MAEDDLIAILDIGAAYCHEPDYKSLLDAGKVRLVGFEPDPIEFAKLTGIFGPPHHFYKCFLGDGNAAIYHETNWAPTGSLFEPNVERVNKFYRLGELMQLKERHSIATHRLDDLENICDIDLIKIDVQGTELAILENGQRVIEDAVVIHTEVSFVELYRNQPLFSDVDEFLRAQGFQFHTFTGLISRSFLPLFNRDNPLNAFNQHLQADAVYVRDWMHFDQIPARKLVHLAVVLHDIYKSFDLAHLALKEADAQLGTTYAAEYLKLLVPE